MVKASVIVIARTRKELRNVIEDLKKQTYKDFETVTISGKMSIPKAWNRGIEKAKGEIIIFTESDCRLPPNFVEKMIENVEETNGGAFGSEVSTFIPCMSAFGIKADIIKNLKFDERYRVVEDTELFYRMLSRGYELKRFNEPIVFHYKKEHGWKRAFWSGYYFAKVKRKYKHLRKNFPGSRFNLKMFIAKVLGFLLGSFL